MQRAERRALTRTLRNATTGKDPGKRAVQVVLPGRVVIRPKYENIVLFQMLGLTFVSCFRQPLQEGGFQGVSENLTNIQLATGWQAGLLDEMRVFS
ncbi:MAG: hypothetical protein Q8K12_12840 [Thiobacillus sp.]|nr:hypothetical protein [Thiobacillus sp.]